VENKAAPKERQLIDSISYLTELLVIYCHTELSLAFCLEVPLVVLFHLDEAI